MFFLNRNPNWDDDPKRQAFFLYFFWVEVTKDTFFILGFGANGGDRTNHM
jgi:hypothetical protein